MHPVVGVIDFIGVGSLGIDGVLATNVVAVVATMFGTSLSVVAISEVVVNYVFTHRKQGVGRCSYGFHKTVTSFRL